MTDTTPSQGVARYVEAAKQAAKRHALAMAAMRSCRFDTIAVHGLYTRGGGARLQPGRDHRADLHELVAGLPRLRRDGGGARRTRSRPGATRASPTRRSTTSSGRWRCSRATACDGETSCCATSSGMAAIMPARPSRSSRVDPAAAHEPLNFVATCQVYGGTFQQFTVPQGGERGIECRWVRRLRRTSTSGRRRSTTNTRFLYGELPSNPQQAFFDIAAVAELAHAHGLPLIVDATVATPALLRPLVPRRRHRRPVGDQDADLRRGSASPARSSPARTSSTSIAQRRAAADFAHLPQVPAQPRLRPEPLADAGDPDAQRHAHAALQDRPA